jgi:hypothetical protein
MPPLVRVGGVLLFMLIAVLAAAVTLLLVPLRAGTVFVPISVLLAVATNLILPPLARELVDRTAAAVLPPLVWFATLVVLAGSRPEGDVLVPGGKDYEGLAWVFYGAVLAGIVAAAYAVIRGAGVTRRPDRVSAPGPLTRPLRRPGPPSGPPEAPGPEVPEVPEVPAPDSPARSPKRRR